MKDRSASTREGLERVTGCSKLSLLMIPATITVNTDRCAGSGITESTSELQVFFSYPLSVLALLLRGSCAAAGAERSMAAARGRVTKQIFRYLAFLDFEATCDEPQVPVQEIIEFPCLKVDLEDFKVTSTFHSYVRPTENPLLSKFCTDLTGITQEMVETQDTFPPVFATFDSWVRNEEIDKHGLFVTCGDWDLRTMLRTQCERENVTVPDYFRSWLNLKQAFAAHEGYWGRSLNYMVDRLDLPFVGRHHSGIDDCRNMVNIAQHLWATGYVFKPSFHAARISFGDGPLATEASRTPC